jgi:hypothetical protein
MWRYRGMASFFQNSIGTFSIHLGPKNTMNHCNNYHSAEVIDNSTLNTRQFGNRYNLSSSRTYENFTALTYQRKKSGLRCIKEFQFPESVNHYFDSQF